MNDRDIKTARLAGIGKTSGISKSKDVPTMPACYKCKFVKRLNATGKEGKGAIRRYFCQRWNDKLTTTNEVYEWEWCEYFKKRGPE